MWSPRLALAFLVASNLFGAVVLSAAPSALSPPAATASDEFFEKRVRPVLAERCYACHGPRVRQAGLRLDRADGLRKGADTGPVVVPGDPEKSSLIRAVRYASPVKMPPAGKLRPDEIAALEEWVRRGASWPAANDPQETDRSRGPGRPDKAQSSPATRASGPHWAFRPITRPAIPRVRHVDWVRNPIDAFVLAELERHGLTPAPPADRRTLIRRATFDLTGLPPTPEETEAFVQDHSPGAWARVVDRLLASPHYGERWGRHWLDVVRYADTAGETADYPVPEAYRYRNYVIDAFNRDKPYDQFLREQIAGDLLAPSGPPECYAERVTATGFLAIARRFGFDPQNYQHLTIEDTIDTLGKATMGLTLGCARCHDHKFDPITSNDYYGLYGIFSSTRYAFPGSEEVKRPRDFVPLVPPAEAAARRKRFDDQMAALGRERQQLEAARAQLQARIGLDGDFELQRSGGSPSGPWVNGPNSTALIRESAQSPFVNVYPPGSRGVEFPNAAAYSGFGQPITVHPTGGRLYYNADLRNTSLSAGAAGSWRYYVGHGPGVSAAVELFVNGEALFARNGDRIDRLAGVRPGEWYNLQLILDLQDKTYSGAFGTPGSVTRFEHLRFAPRWDGAIDYFFVDSYGHIGGVRPGHDVDNLALRDSPIATVVRAAPGSQPVASSDADRLRAELARLEAQSGELERRRADLAAHGPYELAYAVTEGTPADAPLQRRGEPSNRGDVVPRHFPALLGNQRLPAGFVGSGRLQLAEWITDPHNPLTARVIVNRVWQHHFGRGIVRTPNDFGRRGAAPTHPALLDWLTSHFVAGAGVQGPGTGESRIAPESGNRLMKTPPSIGGPGGLRHSYTPPPRHSDTSATEAAPYPGMNWSLKKLHRLIMLSSAYQMSSRGDQRSVASAPGSGGGVRGPGTGSRNAGNSRRFNPQSVSSNPKSAIRNPQSQDPDNRWFSHQNSYRLEAEAIRDAMLFVSGDLDPEMGGPHPFPPVNTWGFTQHAPFTAVYESRKRSVYLMQQRIRKHPFFALFDGAEPNTSTPERVASTTPLQALFMMNDPFAHTQARKLAERVLSGPGSEANRVDRAYRLCFGRPATPLECQEASRFLARAETALRETGTPAAQLEVAAWASLARSLLSANEFLFLD